MLTMTQWKKQLEREFTLDKFRSIEQSQKNFGINVLWIFKEMNAYMSFKISDNLWNKTVKRITRDKNKFAFLKQKYNY